MCSYFEYFFHRIEETAAEKEQRLSNWDQFLVTDEQRDEQKRAEIKDNLPKAIDCIPDEQPKTPRQGKE